MPTPFNLTPDELLQLSERQLRQLAADLSDLGPQQGTPLFDLFNQVSDLADAAFLGNFQARTAQFQQAAQDLAAAAEAATAELKQLGQAAKILDGVTKVVGYIQQAVDIAVKVAPMFALAHGAGSVRPGAAKAPVTVTNANGGYYGWKRDLPDHRDLLYGAIRKIGKKLPSSVDLSSQCSPVENQLSLNSCTANALVGSLEFLLVKEKKTRVDYSRLFLYYNERVLENDVNEDRGARLRDGIKSLIQTGICSEDDWPYDISKVFTAPPATAYQDAVKHELVSYHSIRTLDDMRACLAEGFPVAFGFAVFDAFESDKVAKSGVLNYPAPAEQAQGGHAVLAVGYNDKTQRFLVRNSWGWDWGIKGYFTMPYVYAFGDRTRQALGSDFWTLRQTAEGALTIN